MPLVEKTGDLFTSTADALAHGVNTHGLMGSGIAVAFRQRFAGMYDAYKTACEEGFLRGGGVFIWQDDATGLVIYNAASQEKPGANAKLNLLRSSIGNSLQHAVATNLTSIAIPRIGAGVGGLKWDDVLPVLKELAEEYPTVTLEVWSLPDAV